MPDSVRQLGVSFAVAALGLALAGAASAEERWKPVKLTADDFAAVELSSIDRTAPGEPSVRLVMVRRVAHPDLPGDYLDTQVQVRCATGEFRLRGVQGLTLEGEVTLSDLAETTWDRIGDTSPFYGAFLGLCHERWTDAPPAASLRQFVLTARSVWAAPAS
jgi:hypothetical protein